jgi:hypothetical protein
MKHQILEMILPFISFLLGFNKGKNHYMLAFMLDIRCKGLYLIISYVCHKSVTNLVVDFDPQLLLPLLMETYK